MLPGPAVPGSCLVYFHILWAILSTSTVEVSLKSFGDLEKVLLYTVLSINPQAFFLFALLPSQYLPAPYDDSVVRSR